MPLIAYASKDKVSALYNGSLGLVAPTLLKLQFHAVVKQTTMSSIIDPFSLINWPYFVFV